MRYSSTTTLLFCSVLLHACSDPPSPLNNWLVTASPKSFSIAQGDTLTLEVRVEATNGNFNNVRLSVGGTIAERCTVRYRNCSVCWYV